MGRDKDSKGERSREASNQEAYRSRRPEEKKKAANDYQKQRNKEKYTPASAKSDQVYCEDKALKQAQAEIKQNAQQYET